MNMTGAPDWTDTYQDPKWYVVVGSDDYSGTRAIEGAFIWTAPAPDRQAAEAMALGDAHRAFAVQAAMRGASAVLPAAVAKVRSCDREAYIADWPSFTIGEAMTNTLAAHGEPRPIWSDDAIAAIGEAAMRCVASKASLPHGGAVCAIYGDESTSSPDPELSFAVVSCSFEARSDGTEFRRDRDELSVPGPLRPVLLALAIALMAGRDPEARKSREGLAPIAVPASATLRAAMRARLASTRAADAASVARFLEEAGLGADAAEFLAAFGS
jgi:hypothetical protein